MDTLRATVGALGLLPIAYRLPTLRDSIDTST